MFSKLLLLFILTPVIEIYLLVKAGEHIGSVNTIGLVILTGVIGASFAKSQGAQIFFKIRGSLNRGQMPGRELLEGAMILAGGIMLLTPGFITDLLGFSLLLPVTRNVYTGLALTYFKKKFRDGQWSYSEQPGSEEQPHREDVIIDHPPLDEG
ncbi:MAG: membrane protein FxsA [Candidatus Aminicenantes bacterium]|nr:membrane protein FxsA [Candidatus Aminicenantes bacterium]